MAVKAPTSPQSVPLFVVIVVLVLFLASAIGLIIMFVNHEKLSQQAQQAQDQFDQYIGRARQKLEPYKEMGRSSQPKTSAVAALLEDHNRLAQLASGNPNDTADGVQENLNMLVSALPQEIPGLGQLAGADMIGAIKLMAQSIRNLVAQSQQSGAQMEQFGQQRDTMTKSYQALEQKFATSSEEYLAKLQQLADQFEKFRQESQAQLEGVQTDVAGRMNKRLATMEKDFIRNLDELRDMVQRNLKLLAPARKTAYAQQQQTTAPPAALALGLEPDGKVMQVSEDGQVAYIDLGQENQLPHGMRLLVLSAADRPHAKSGPKGLLEVIKVGSVTSTCRIIQQNKGQPITSGDKVMNIAYSSADPHLFMVFGQFDLDYDRSADPDGVAIVRQMITSAGAKAVQHLGPTLDFLVVGLRPSEPDELDPNASEEEVAKSKEQLDKYRQYQQLLSQARDMGITVLQQDQFLLLMGMDLSR